MFFFENKKSSAAYQQFILVVVFFFFYIAHQLSQIYFYHPPYSQDLAEHLVMHAHCLSSKDHTELSSLFNLGQESSRGAMDRRVALAVANLDIPRSWNVLGSHGGDGENAVIRLRRTDVRIKSTLGFSFKQCL